MPEREGPKVVLRGPAEGESIILPMGRQRARITRKASRTETGGHWAIGEAWQDPGFDNPPQRMMKQKPSTSLKVATPSTPAPLPQRESDQAHSSSFRLAPFTGSEPVQKAGDYFASGHRPSRPRSQWISAEPGRPVSHAGCDGLSSYADLRLTGLPVLTPRRLVRADSHGHLNVAQGRCPPPCGAPSGQSPPYFPGWSSVRHLPTRLPPSSNSAF
jgi:hypothetical protein